MAEPTGPAAAAADDDWRLLQFLLQLRTDQAAGRPRPLRDYLADHPDAELPIAREYLRAHAGADPGAGAAAPAEGGNRCGPYRLLQPLGRGGQGTVYLAVDPLLGREVALKILHHEADELAAARLWRAAALAARLDHPALARIHGAGRDGARLWVASQFLPGPSLAHELAARRSGGSPWSAREVGQRLAPIAHGLHHAHQHGVLHRDVTPANLLLAATGEWVLTDFGLARGDAAAAGLTASGELRGTPGFVAPELLQRGRATAAADVFALGAVAYACATLAAPFAAATPAQALAQSLGTEVWQLPGWRSLPADLRAVLARALAKSPAQRYASAAAFAADLERLAAGEPVAARPPGPWRRLAALARREPLGTAGLGLALAALLGGLGAAVGLLHREQQLRQAAEARAARTRAIASEVLFAQRHRLGEAADGAAARRRAVARATEALAGLAAAAPDDLRLQRELCLAWLELGDAHAHDPDAHLGDPASALVCYQEAEWVATGRLARDPEQPLLLAQVALRRAELLPRAAAEPLCRAALALAPAGARQAGALRQAATACLAVHARELPDAARAAFWLRALAAERGAAAADRDQRHNDAVHRLLQASVLAELGAPDAAAAVAGAVLLGLPPGAGAAAARLRAQAHQTLGNCAMLLGDPATAAAQFAAARAALQERVRHDPSDRGARERLAEVDAAEQRFAAGPGAAVNPPLPPDRAPRAAGPAAAASDTRPPPR